jgi:prepilin-type N-terminal cleavage/methylation domain-containing protein
LRDCREERFNHSITPSFNHSMIGFTLIEMIVVVTILGIMFGTLVPYFRGSFTDLEMRDAVRNVAATMKYAQQRAMLQQVQYRVNFDKSTGEYWLTRQADPLEDPDEFVEILAEQGRVKALPASVVLKRVTAKLARGGRFRYVNFYPTGRIAKANIVLEGPGYRSFSLSTDDRIGQIEVKERR